MASEPPDREALLSLYRGYLTCLNEQDWARLGDFVHPEVTHNARPLGLAGYREMLEGDHRAIPDLHFDADTLAADPPVIAARLRFDCTPVGMLFDLPVNGRRVRFDEHVFYRVADGRIRQVHSLIDRDAIAAQI
ncbi:ester cyclase [Thioclava sp. F1Mire-8]|uniref:ester cyclase n=1 Tax=Thioclava sp. F1Mire-8 TaxID=1973006 RepID=UPI000B544FB8|nr:ester cyclase [Thioclava sp. F1Mire-8]OWY05115.1 ester cyclase [Thioclava sp. F1Mire-8]